MKAIEELDGIKEIQEVIELKILQNCIWDMDECDEAIEEIKTLQQELKQGQDNYNKLWDMYSELKIENKILQEYINETKDCMYCKEARAIKIYDERKLK